jgi:hypothetical protein
MRRFCDSATVPSRDALSKAHADGVRGWAGYLPSPYATHGWTPTDFHGVALAVGAVLPVYVMPYNRATLARRNPNRDAAQAVAGFHALGMQGHTLCLDIERGAWDADPAAVLDYFRRFAAITAKAGIDVMPYGAATTAVGLAHYQTLRAVWVASWNYQAGTFKGWPGVNTPRGIGTAWPNARAWQFAGDVKRYGMRVDCNLADGNVPFCSMPAATHPAPHPPPKPVAPPHPPPKLAPAPVPPKPATAPAAPPADTATATIVVGGKSYTGTLRRS